MTRDYPSAVLANLHRGRDGARSLSDLAEALGCPRRVLERSVQELRRRGHPIASGNEGVWIAENYRDLAETYQQLRHRVVEQSRTAWKVRATMRRLRTAEEVGEQECLFWPEVAA